MALNVCDAMKSQRFLIPARQQRLSISNHSGRWCSTASIPVRAWSWWREWARG